MACRIVIFHPDGRALYAIDGHHGDHHAAAWAAATADTCRAQGVDPVIVEFDPFAGGDTVREHVRQLHHMRLDVHVNPGGAVDVLGVAVAGVSIARAVRVLDGPAEYTKHPRGIHARGRSGADLAQAWRRVSDYAFKRQERKRGRA